MKQSLSLTFALALGLPVLAQAQTSHSTVNSNPTVRVAQNPAAANRRPQLVQGVPRFAQGTPVVIVGEITSQPKDILNEHKMQVGIGPSRMDFTLHLSDAKLYGYQGGPTEAKDLRTKMWVRAEGTVMDDPRRVKVTRLQVIGKDQPSLQQSAFYRPGFDQGYVVAVAGSQQIFPETRDVIFTPAAMTIIGMVSSDTGPLESTRKIQVDAAGNVWTLNVPKNTPIYDTRGQKISVHQIAKGQWIRAHGWQTNDLRIRAARIENVGAEEAFRTSTYFRAGEPMGYVERLPGTGVRFNPVRFTGTVSAVDAQAGTVTIKEEQGMERILYPETVMFTAEGRRVDISALRPGQRVSVEGNTIEF